MTVGMRTVRLVAALPAALAVVVAGCGSGSHSGTGSMPKSSSSMSPGMQMVDRNTGLASSEQGYTLDSSILSFHTQSDRQYRFRILGPSGKVQIAFVEDQTKLLHFYAVRADLTNYQHLHPRMAPDGTWSVPLPLVAPGTYRVYASFIAKDSASVQHELVLSRQLTVPGSYDATTLPAASDAAEVDGYTVTLQGQLTSGVAGPFKIHIAKGGRPVTNLQPYLDTYAHVTAIRSGDLAFAHLHPDQSAALATEGGPDLSFHTQLPASGNYRLFLQFQTEGQLHTAALTVRAK